jgi:hypothetical protein
MGLETAMKCSTRRGLVRSLWVSAFVLGSCLRADPPVGEPSDYTIILPKEVSLEKVQIYYVLARHAGGFFWGPVSELKSAKDHGFVFPTKVGDWLEAGLYYPGYQFATIDEPSVTTSEHRVAVAFQSLPVVVLKGKCPLYHSAPEYAHLKFSVRISYHGSGLTHLKTYGGYGLFIADVPISADGTFTAKIPNFYHDPLSSQDELRGLEFRVSSTSPAGWLGFVSYDIAPEGPGDFKIEPTYRGRKEFVIPKVAPLDHLNSNPQK